MDENRFFEGLLVAMFVVAAFTLAFSLFVLAPYGRFQRTRWSGPELPSWLAWIWMESPQFLGFLFWFLTGVRQANPVAIVFFGIWNFHYVYRTFIYPFIPRNSTLSLSVVLLGFFLNLLFSYLNGRWIFALGPEREIAWLQDPRFIVGASMFFGGFVLCSSSDAILRALRTSGEKSYQIPTQGAYRWISCPNYLGEIIQWAGWTLATWSLAGLTIFVITAANLIPRSRANHRWYRQRFPDYPLQRKALIPYLF